MRRRKKGVELKLREEINVIKKKLTWPNLNIAPLLRSIRAFNGVGSNRVNRVAEKNQENAEEKGEEEMRTSH